MKGECKLCHEIEHLAEDGECFECKSIREKMQAEGNL